ncbi:hypothetical protein KCU93_g322, partial [Aureobasidium melanogenum]
MKAAMAGLLQRVEQLVAVPYAPPEGATEAAVNLASKALNFFWRNQFVSSSFQLPLFQNIEDENHFSLCWEMFMRVLGESWWKLAQACETVWMMDSEPPGNDRSREIIVGLTQSGLSNEGSGPTPLIPSRVAEPIKTYEQANFANYRLRRFLGYRM